MTKLDLAQFQLVIQYFHRSGSPELQVEIATRIVKLVDHPNLLLDSTLTWDVDLLLVPRLNYVPPGWNQMRMDDSDNFKALGLPQDEKVEGHHLLILATGSYTIKRGQVTLTAARENELQDERMQNNTGSIEN